MLVVNANAAPNKDSCAYCAEANGVESAGAAEIDYNAGSYPDYIAAGFDTGKRQLIHGAYCTHKGIGSREHQVGSNNEYNAQSGHGNTGHQKENAYPEAGNRKINNEHAEVYEITKGYGKRQSQYYPHGRAAVYDYLTYNADHMKSNGHIAEGERGDGADGIGHR